MRILSLYLFCSRKNINTQLRWFPLWGKNMKILLYRKMNISLNFTLCFSGFFFPLARSAFSFALHCFQKNIAVFSLKKNFCQVSNPKRFLGQNIFSCSELSFHSQELFFEKKRPFNLFELEGRFFKWRGSKIAELCWRLAEMIFW